ncbi:MAG: chorismate mutase [Hyphomicrobiales bacterium]|nr:chorismate mutase [Hyphomicrobiales bacterium]
MPEEKKKNNGLKELREDLDKIDIQLKELIKERAEIAEKISVIKKEHNLPIYHPSRELEILRRLQKSDLSPLNIKLIWNIWRALINANTAIQAQLDIYIENNLDNANREIIINNFGHENNVIEHNHPIKLLSKQENKNNSIAVIESKSLLLEEIDKSEFGIIGVLPVINFGSNVPSLYIIGEENYITTNDDTTMLKIVINLSYEDVVENKIDKLSLLINQEIEYTQQISTDTILFALRSVKIESEDLLREINSEKYIKKAVIIGQYATPIDLRR